MTQPLLLLALEEYFKAPYPETLEHLYDAVNAMDLSLMPRLTTLERQLLLASDANQLFIEKFEQMIQQRMQDEAQEAAAAETGSPLKQSFPDLARPPRYQLPRDTHEYETRVIYHSIPIPIKVPTAVAPETVGDFSIIKLIQTFAAPHAAAPQPFPLHPHLTTSGAFTHPIIVLLNAILTEKRVMFLGHNRPSGEVAAAVLAACALASGSILRGFTRHAFPYTDLSKIDDLLNVPGFIAGVTNPAFAHHPEWWDLLCDLPTGRMKISARIEPALPNEGLLFFRQQHPAYAPSDTGALPSTAATAAAAVPPSVPGSAAAPASGAASAAQTTLLHADPTGDALFVDDVLRAIAQRHGELAIRAKFRAYVRRLTRLAAAFEEAVYGASTLHVGSPDVDAEAQAQGLTGHGQVWGDEAARARDLGAQAWRIEGWRSTRSYYALVSDLAALWSEGPRPGGRRPRGLRLVRGLDVAHQLDRLRALRLGPREAAPVYRALSARVRGYDAVCQLLAAAPESQAGLFHVGLGLLHPDRAVRRAVAALLARVRAHAAGRHWWAGLGRFLKVAFARVLREAAADAAAGEGEEEVELVAEEEDEAVGRAAVVEKVELGKTSRGWRGRRVRS